VKQRAPAATAVPDRPSYPLPEPTQELPGTEGKIAVLTQRASRGQQLFHPQDKKGPPMLVLTRKIGEGLCVSSDVRIQVIAVDQGSGTVRLGIEAPPAVEVLRAELVPGYGPPPEPKPKPTAAPRRRCYLAWTDDHGVHHVDKNIWPSRAAAERARRLLLRRPGVASVRVVECRPPGTLKTCPAAPVSPPA
jgi:carbon storage regulator CsrA